MCRRPAHKRHGGLWEFPGGKLEPGESLLVAARRELREELAVDVRSVGDPAFVQRDAGSPFVIEFAEVDIAGEPALREHEQLRWATLDQLRCLPLAPADRSFVSQRLDGAAPS